MNGISVDPVELTARVGAGANFGLLNAVLDGYGLHVPGGTCADVGVAGFMQGGGYGLTSRRFGINSDCVLAVTMMLADGTIVVADETRERDLWWAVRGGTGNQFGVLLDITYKVVELPSVWSFELRWTVDDAPAALDAIQRGLHARRRQRRRRLPGRDGDARQRAVPADARALLRRRPRTGCGRCGRCWTSARRSSATVTGTYNTLERRGASPCCPARACRRRWRPSAAATSRRRSAWTGWKALVDYFATTPNPYNIMVPGALRRGARRPTRGRTRRSSTARSTATSSSTPSGTRRGRTATRRPR